MYVIVENTGDIGQLRRKHFSRTTVMPEGEKNWGTNHCKWEQ